MRRKYAYFAAVAGIAVAADQVTKWWAVETLKHECEELGAERAGAIRITRCHNESLTVELGAPARQVAFLRGNTPFYGLTCHGNEPCLSGAVRLGEERPEAQRLRFERPPMDQALLMLRGLPLEVATLTSGGDGQMYRIEATDAAGKTASLRFRYRSPGRHVTVVENLFHLRYVENPGAAWGLLSDVDERFRSPLFTGISITALLFILWVYRRADASERLLGTALALVLGGALGNFIDRMRFGRVVDFIDWHYHDKVRWPTFNVADAAITVGVGLLLIDAFRGWRRSRRMKRQEEGTAP